MGLLDTLVGGVLGGVRGPSPSRGRTQSPFKTHLTVTDGLPVGVYGTAALVAAIIAAGAAGGPWTLIWQTVVPAQQQMRWGYGSPATPQNQGYMWFYSVDVTVDVTVGVLRLVQANARQTDVRTVLEINDEALHTAVNTLIGLPLLDKNQMIALPEKREFPRVGEDSLMQLWYRIVTVATAEDTVNFSIPVTVYQ